MKKTIYIISLKDAFGDVRHVVVDDTSDNVCIGGRTLDGTYHQ